MELVTIELRWDGCLRHVGTSTLPAIQAEFGLGIPVTCATWGVHVQLEPPMIRPKAAVKLAETQGLVAQGS